MQRAFFERTKSIAGIAFLVIGIFILHEHVDRAMAQLSHIFGHAGIALPAVFLVALRVVQPYAADHQRFLQDFVMQIVTSSWPLVLVVVGTVLSRERSGDEGNALPKQNSKSVDLIDRRSTLK